MYFNDINVLLITKVAYINVMKIVREISTFMLFKNTLYLNTEIIWAYNRYVVAYDRVATPPVFIENSIPRSLS